MSKKDRFVLMGRSGFLLQLNIYESVDQSSNVYLWKFEFGKRMEISTLPVTLYNSASS